MPIYLDNMAATPVDTRVADYHADQMLALPANPHSGEHADGAAAGAALREAQERLGRFARRDADHITLSPGASPAIWLAIEDALARAGARPARILASAAEHPALLFHARSAAAAGRATLHIIPVDDCGIPCVDAAAELSRDGADLICTMAANNEVGTITPTAPFAALAHRVGARLLVDASQAAGRVPMTLYEGADYLVLSGAKIYGPRRAGVLAAQIVEPARKAAAYMFGSPDAAGACALALACELREAEGGADEDRIAAMRDRLEAHLLASVPGLRVNGSSAGRIAGSLHVSAPDMPGEVVVARLWDRISLSTGAACQTGVPGPSHVLKAMALPEWVADGALRIGIGKANTMEEIDEAAGMIADAMNPAALRRRA